MRARPLALLLTLLALVAAGAAGWLLPALQPGPAAHAEGGCEASGFAAAGCRFACREGQAVSVFVEVEWGWRITRAVGTATCGSETAHCEVRSTFCTSGLFQGGATAPVDAPLLEGTCIAEKLPFPWYPGSVRVSCSSSG